MTFETVQTLLEAFENLEELFFASTGELKTVEGIVSYNAVKSENYFNLKMNKKRIK